MQSSANTVATSGFLRLKPRRGSPWRPLMGALAACVALSLGAGPARADLPKGGAMAFDLGVLATMFLTHWYWTAFAYAVSCGSLALIQARRTSG